MWKKRSLTRGAILLAATLAVFVSGLALFHPGFERRVVMLNQKVQGRLPGVSWKEVGVQLAPGAWRFHIRSLSAASPPAWIEKLDVAADETLPFESHRVFRGSTTLLRHLDIHLTTLPRGKRPHPPHRHDDEELIIPISGAVEIIRLDENGAEGSDSISPGRFVYHRANRVHTIEAAALNASAYLVVKWVGDRVPNLGQVLDSSLFDFGTASASLGGTDRGFASKVLFESPTLYLTELQCHVSIMNPGAGYDPHPDAYDVAILVLEGVVETLGKQVGPNHLIFYPAGQPHGMRNVGEVPARYLVFEFHV